MRPTAAFCLVLSLTTGAALADPWLAPKLYGEGLDLGRYEGGLVEGHPPGYFPNPVRARTTLFPRGKGGFEILVTPNLVGYGEATARAAAAAKSYCGTSGGGVAAVITGQERYAELSLESWSFAGRCR